MGNDNAMVLVLGVIVLMGALAYYQSVNDHHQMEETKRLAAIEAEVAKMPFDLSCAPDGRLDGGDKRNCTQGSGYRIGRNGFATFVAKLDDKGQPTQIFSWGPDLYRQANPGFWRAMYSATGAGR